ncbi:MAG: ABC transporter ATP-binding protein [Mycoplasma sp.]
MFFIEKKSDKVKLIEKLNKPHKGPKMTYKANHELIVDIKNVQKSYISSSIISQVLKNVDIQIMRGEFVVILGPSGSGKTTLMNIISGLDRATTGQVDVAGNCLINLTDDELTKFRRINVGYIFQQYGLIPNLKVRENILIGSYLHKLNRKELIKNKKNELCIVEDLYEQEKNQIKNGNSLFSYLIKAHPYMDINDYVYFYNYFLNDVSKKNIFKYATDEEMKSKLLSALEDNTNTWRKSIEDSYEEFNYENMDDSIDDIMKTLGIYEIKDKYPSQLSGGQQQRVSIARVFAKKPKIIFADEPTGAVDNSMSDTILDAFVEMNKKYNITVILVTHNPEIAKLATKVVYFKDGYIERIEEQ